MQGESCRSLPWGSFSWREPKVCGRDLGVGELCSSTTQGQHFPRKGDGKEAGTGAIYSRAGHQRCSACETKGAAPAQHCPHANVTAREAGEVHTRSERESVLLARPAGIKRTDLWVPICFIGFFW